MVDLFRNPYDSAMALVRVGEGLSEQRVILSDIGAAFLSRHDSSVSAISQGYGC